MNGKGPNLIVGIAELLVITTISILWISRLKLIPYITGQGKLLPGRILVYSCPSSEMPGTGLRDPSFPQFSTACLGREWK
jgi:hypothetical protein